MRSRPMVALLLVAVLVAAAAAQSNRSTPRENAPRFTAKTTTGEKFSNDSVKGKVVLLEFWTTWCPYCRSEQSLVDQIDKQYSGQGLVLLAIDVGESKKTVQKYLQQNPRTCKIVLTDDTNLAAMYAATSYPIYVAIDADGKIAGIQHGAGGENALLGLLSDAGLKTEP